MRRFEAASQVEAILSRASSCRARRGRRGKTAGRALVRKFVLWEGVASNVERYAGMPSQAPSRFFLSQCRT